MSGSAPLPKTILVTGGAGFIGSAFLNLLVPLHSEVQWVNMDALTYAGNLLNLAGISEMSNYAFEKADISSAEDCDRLFEKWQPDWVFNFAAETHVDRSIKNPRATAATNFRGTLNLLESARSMWKSFEGKIFHQISTDEVFGDLGDSGAFNESTGYHPSSPYSATKASADHMVHAYYRTYGMPTRSSQCSNNYGPRQFPEKLIPLMILNSMEGKKLPVYGTGKNVRDWLYVDDHARAIWAIASGSKDGETFTVGARSELTNLQIVEKIVSLVKEKTGVTGADVEFVADRPGHDWRYAIDPSRLEGELGWRPEQDFESGLSLTVDWYLNNTAWVDSVRSGSYREWMQEQYGESAQ